MRTKLRSSVKRLLRGRIESNFPVNRTAEQPRFGFRHPPRAASGYFLRSMPTFDDFKAALTSATQEHYRRYVEKYPNESYYGYSLYTDDDVSSIGPVATRSSAIRVGPENEMFVCYRYGPHEWPDWDDFGLFADVNRILKELYSNKFLGFSRYKKKSLEIAFSVLKELESDGFFGPRNGNRYVVLWLSDSIDPIMDKAVKELNSADIWTAYASEYVDI